MKIKKNNLGFLANFVLWLVLSDIIFYTTHRLFHTKKLYFIHSIHHTYRHTFGISALYAHPIEFVLNNLGSLVTPIFLLGIPLNYLKIILVVSTFTTVIISHGGYLESQSHYVHHLKYKYNYGLFICDHIFGTYLKIKN